MSKLVWLSIALLILALAGPAPAADGVVGGELDLAIEEVEGTSFVTNIDFPYQHLKVTNNSVSAKVIQFEALVDGGEGPNIFPQLNILYLDPGESNYVFSYLDIVSGDFNLDEANTVTRTWDYTFSDYYSSDQATYSTTWNVATWDSSNTPSAGQIGGRVVSARGAGVPSARVSLLATQSAGGQSFQQETVAGSDGSFRLNLPALSNHLYLQVKADGYLDGFQTIDPNNPTGLQITQTPGSAGSPRLTTVNSITDPIGFWRAKMSADESKFLIIQGMENWEDESLRPQSQLRLYDADGNQLWAIDMGWEGWAADLSDDGAWAVYATMLRDGVYALVNAASGETVWSLNLQDLQDLGETPMPDKMCREIVFNHAADKVVLGTSEGGVYFLDRATGQVTATAFLDGLIRKIVFPADDSVAYVSSGDGYLYALDPATGATLWRVYVRAWLYTNGLVISPDGLYIAAAAKTGYGVLVRLEDQQVAFEQSMGSINAHCAAFHPENEGVFFGSQTRGGYFDLTGQAHWYTEIAHSAVFSPSGDYLITGGGRDNGIKVIHTDSGTEVVDAIDNTSIAGNLNWLYVTRDGSRLYAAGEEGTLRVYDCAW